MYRIDSLHPDRLVCDACATAIGAVALAPAACRGQAARAIYQA
jgi:hypothetical protein